MLVLDKRALRKTQLVVWKTNLLLFDISILSLRTSVELRGREMQSIVMKIRLIGLTTIRQSSGTWTYSNAAASCDNRHKEKEESIDSVQTKDWWVFDLQFGFIETEVLGQMIHHVIFFPVRRSGDISSVLQRRILIRSYAYFLRQTTLIWINYHWCTTVND